MKIKICISEIKMLHPLALYYLLQALSHFLGLIRL